MNDNVVDIKVVSMKSWCRNDSLVEMLEVMLQSAKEGTIVGAAGVFLIYEDETEDGEGGASLGTMQTENMQDNVFTVVGALEKIKLGLLAGLQTE